MLVVVTDHRLSEMDMCTKYSRHALRLFLSGILSFLLVSGVHGQSLAVTPPSMVRLPDFSELVDKAGPAVVNIRTTEKSARINLAGSEDQELQDFLHRFFGFPAPGSQPKGPRRQRPYPQPEEEIRRGIGSGFIISPDGYILTNAHVVDGADEVNVKLTDRREYKARIVGIDTRTDVGLVKIDGANLPFLKPGRSGEVRAGEWVIAIGSPFDLDNTVTAGIVSAKARDTGDYLPLIQTDVAVNPGNSGGPLINMRGEAIGITSQIYSRSGGYMGISFAIPIDEALQVADQLKASGKVTRGRIGVQIGEVSAEVAQLLGLEKKQGAVIRSVEPGGPADKGGLQAGDVILRYNGEPIDRYSDLPRRVGNTRPGSSVKLSVWRKGAIREVDVTVAESEAARAESAEKRKEGKSDKSGVRVFGMVVGDLTEGQKAQLQVDGGVYVTAVEGAAARAGLRPGDVILRVGNTDVRNAREFNALLARQSGKGPVLFLVRRGDITQFVPVRPAGAR